MLSIQLGAMGVVVLFIIIVLAKDNRKKELETKNKRRSLADVVLARLKIVIGYYQVRWIICKQQEKLCIMYFWLSPDKKHLETWRGNINFVFFKKIMNFGF